MNLEPAELQKLLDADPDKAIRDYATGEGRRTVASLTSAAVRDTMGGKTRTVPQLLALVGRVSEHDEQVALFAWIEANQAAHPELRMFFAVPNGGRRDIATAGKLKQEGVRAGVPDVIGMVPRRSFHGIAIELKVGRNKPTDQQNEWLSGLRWYGYQALVCFGADEAIAAIRYYLGMDE